MQRFQGVRRSSQLHFISKVSIFILVTIFFACTAHSVWANTGPRDLKLSALQTLTDVQGNNKKDAKAIQKAISHIEKSLADSLWEDSARLAPDPKGKQVFHEEHKAVQQLKKIAQSKKISEDIKNAVLEALEDLVAADRAIAQTALSEASAYAGTSKKVDHFIEKCEENLQKGERLRDKAKHAKAIKAFEQAWHHAQLTIKHAGGEQPTPVASLTVTITSPEHGTTTNRSKVIVEGTYEAEAGEVGIVINSISATVFENRFVANGVHLEPGENSITVTITDTSGNTDVTSITVYRETVAHYVRLTANIESGVAPLEVSLRAEVVLDGESAHTELGYSGPADMGVTLVSNEEFILSFPDVPGMYYITFSATDAGGTVYGDTVVITIFDRAQLDALLQAKWSGMKQALIDGDIDGALGYHHEKSKAKYSEIFTLLRDEIGSVFSSLGDTELIYLKATMAKYRIRRYQDIDGQDKWVTYYIYFVKDGWGMWKIRSF